MGLARNKGSIRRMRKDIARNKNFNGFVMTVMSYTYYTLSITMSAITTRFSRLFRETGADGTARTFGEWSCAL